MTNYNELTQRTEGARALLRGDALALRAKRLALGWTFGEAAHNAGVTINSIVRYEKGERVNPVYGPFLDVALELQEARSRIEALEADDDGEVPVYHQELDALALELVTPEVQRELDALSWWNKPNPTTSEEAARDMTDDQRRHKRLADLTRQHAARAVCAVEVSRHYIADAMRKRRRERRETAAVEAIRPSAGEGEGR